MQTKEIEEGRVTFYEVVGNYSECVTEVDRYCKTWNIRRFSAFVQSKILIADEWHFVVKRLTLPLENDLRILQIEDRVFLRRILNRAHGSLKRNLSQAKDAWETEVFSLAIMHVEAWMTNPDYYARQYEN